LPADEKVKWLAVFMSRVIISTWGPIIRVEVFYDLPESLKADVEIM
jgi:hypothetical protein